MQDEENQDSEQNEVDGMKKGVCVTHNTFLLAKTKDVV